MGDDGKSWPGKTNHDTCFEVLCEGLKDMEEICPSILIQLEVLKERESEVSE
jgi:hypothetical protein